MGKITSLVEFQGKVGNLVGYRGKDGRSVIRQHRYDTKNAKSVLQMRRRVSWANMVNVYKALAAYMQPAFENKDAGQSDYNAFTQANIDANCVFLTKSESRTGTCVVAPYLMSRGTLQPISLQSVAGGKIRTDIALGDLSIDGDTTISALSKAILNNDINGRFLEGDQITGILLVQSVVGDMRIPRANAIVGGFIIDKNDNRKVWDVYPSNVFASADGYLGTQSTVNGGVCWIHTRIENGKTLASTQQLMVNNNLLEVYQGASKQEEAMQSYGVNRKNFLTPTGNRYKAEDIDPMP